MFRYALVFSYLLTFICLPLMASDLELLEANNKYKEALKIEEPKLKEQLFTESLNLYLKYLNTKDEIAPFLHYNIGTIYLSQSQFGPAIYHLKQAHEYLPDDQRVVSNLQKAAKLGQVRVFPEKNNDFSSILDSLWDSRSVKLFQLVAIFISFICCLLYLFVFKRSRPFLIFSILMSLLFLGSSYMRFINYGVSQKIVLLDQYNPKSGGSENYPNILNDSLKAGSVGRIIQSEPEWIFINWGDKIEGWVPKKKLAIIR